MDLKRIISHCKEYGFIFPSSEIYDGLSAIYDYGPFGVELKNKIKEYWWKSMVQENENIVGIDSSIFMHPEKSQWESQDNQPLLLVYNQKIEYNHRQHLQHLMSKLL